MTANRCLALPTALSHLNYESTRYSESALCSLKNLSLKKEAFGTTKRTASGFDEDYLGLMPGGQGFARPQVGADVFAYGRVGAASCLDGKNPEIGIHRAQNTNEKKNTQHGC